MLRNVWLACVLSVALPMGATAWGQSAPAVDRAQAAERSAEQKLAQLTTQRAQLARQLQEQNDHSERLKKEKPSWRRDRELKAALADASDTANRMTAIDAAIRAAQRDVAARRSVAVTAIDAELAAGAAGTRADQLRRMRAQLAPAVVTAKKIVIPDAEIDPLADPEELDRQAVALASAEKQLAVQQQALDDQAKQLRRNADLRSAHERAGELSTRDDDQPRRIAASGTNGRSSPESPATLGTSGGTSGGNDSGQFNDKGSVTASSSFESSAVALGEAVDRSTIEGLQRASRSSDPKQRADAAEAARDAVAKRLDQLRKKRAMIEQRAKQLRKK